MTTAMYNKAIFSPKLRNNIDRLLHKLKYAIIIFSSLVYILVLIKLFPTASFGVAAFSIVPVSIIGLYEGPKFGFLAGIVFIFINLSVFQFLGVSLPQYIRDSALIGSIAVTLVGTGVGYFSMLNKRLKQEIIERRQIQQELNELNGKLETQTQRALQARAQFLTAMSHKLRTPMNASIGLSTLLLEDNPNMVNGDYIHDILRSNREVVGIVDSILEYTKIESGDIELNVEEFTIDKLLEQVTHDARKRAIEQNVSLHTVIDSQAPNRLIGDPKRLLLILGNLFNNALDATQNGDSITLSIKPDWIDKKGEQVFLKIAVADTGQGISSDKLTTLFDPFSSSYESTTKVSNRAGIGAALCRSLCKKMGGEIEAESKVNEGTTITVTLPFNLPKSANK